MPCALDRNWSPRRRQGDVDWCPRLAVTGGGQVQRNLKRFFDLIECWRRQGSSSTPEPAFGDCADLLAKGDAVLGQSGLAGSQHNLAWINNTPRLKSRARDCDDDGSGVIDGVTADYDDGPSTGLFGSDRGVEEGVVDFAAPHRCLGRCCCSPSRNASQSADANSSLTAWASPECAASRAIPAKASSIAARSIDSSSRRSALATSSFRFRASPDFTARSAAARRSFGRVTVVRVDSVRTHCRPS